MSRAVDVGGGTECKRPRKLSNSPALDQVIKTGRLGFYWLSARLTLGSTSPLY